MEKILIAGGSGMVGKSLLKALQHLPYEVSILSRSPKKFPNVKTYLWNLDDQTMDLEALDTDYIINLAGAGIADKPWTKKRKKELILSRTLTAETICKNLASTGKRIKGYIGASAIGYYGNTGDQLLTEKDDSLKNDFLSEVCIAWEEATKQLKEYSDVVSIARIGIVLDKQEGALNKMLLPFKFGTASYFGNGKQIYSWIHKEDLASLLLFILENKLAGIYNTVAPNPVNNKQLIYSIKETKNSLAIPLSVPITLLKLAMGELSAVVLNSNKVSAEKISQSGFSFKYTDIKEALSQILL